MEKPQKTCKKCSKEYDEKFTYCPNCGKKWIEKRKDNGDKPIPLEEYTPINMFAMLKNKYPGRMLFIQNGMFYELFGDDAKEGQRLFGWRMIEKCGTDFTGVPHWAYRFKEKLKSLNKPYVIVESFVEDGYLKREVVEVYP